MAIISLLLISCLLITNIALEPIAVSGKLVKRSRATYEKGYMYEEKGRKAVTATFREPIGTGVYKLKFSWEDTSEKGLVGGFEPDSTSVILRISRDIKAVVFTVKGASWLFTIDESNKRGWCDGCLLDGYAKLGDQKAPPGQLLQMKIMDSHGRRKREAPEYEPTGKRVNAVFVKGKVEFKDFDGKYLRSYKPDAKYPVKFSKAQKGLFFRTKERSYLFEVNKEELARLEALSAKLGSKANIETYNMIEYVDSIEEDEAAYDRGMNIYILLLTNYKLITSVPIF